MKIPPTREQVETYCKSRGNKVDVDKFMVYYEDAEPPWSVPTRKQGVRRPMVSWRSCIITWEQQMSATHSISSAKQRDKAVTKEKAVRMKPVKKGKANPEIAKLTNKTFVLARFLVGARGQARSDIKKEIRDIGKQIQVIKDEEIRLGNLVK